MIFQKINGRVQMGRNLTDRDGMKADTNWRLMTDGISYRTGILTGRLRAYETEEDLLRLVKK